MSDFHLLGTDLFGDEIKADAKGKLRERFDFPPFSVLNAREGPWQERKRAWLACGIQSEVGRGENLLKMSDTLLEPDPEKRAAMQAARSTGDARTFGSGDPGDLAASFRRKETASLDGGLVIGTTTDPYRKPGEEVDGAGGSGTSIFDPVLTELCYRWFCPPGGQIVDPFAGGSVRGIVAGLLGFRYHGIDLRPEQIAANEAQRALICPEANINWVVGDSNKMLLEAPMADVVFSCHPASVRVLTETRGPIPINEIRVGERVVSHTGELQEVSECLSRCYTGRLLSISRDYRRGLPLLVTDEHPLLIKRIDAPVVGLCKCGCGESTDRHYKRGHNNKHHKGLWGAETESGEATNELLRASRAEVVRWLSASYAREGDYLLEPLPVKPENPVDQQVVWNYEAPTKTSLRGRVPSGPTEVRATADVCRLLGYYLAEGSAPERAVGFAFNKKEKTFHDDVVSLWRSIFGGAATLRPNAVGNGVTITCSGTIGAQFLRTAGNNAGNKAFPQWVWNCSNELLSEVIKGAWSGDGWVNSGSEYFAFASCSERLVEDLRRALLRFDIVASVRCRAPRPTNYCATPRAQWNLIVRGDYATKLAKIIGVWRETKARSRPSHSPEIVNGYVQYRIDKIESRPVVDLPVYNLEVNEDHSFLAEGVASHNCPPYFDLEQYSDDPADISSVSWDQFVGIYRAIIRKAVERMKPNTFAVFVVGEVRDKKTGLYRGFVPLTCASFMAVGAAFYNSAILITSVGSLPIRITKQFESSRKLGTTHQHVLCFVKGDPKIAAENIRAATAPDATAPIARPRPTTFDLGAPGPASAASGALAFAAAAPDAPAPRIEVGPTSMADFLGNAPYAPVSDWQAQAPPSLEGITNIVLNFETNGLDWAGGSRPIGVTVGTLDGGLKRFLPFAFKGGGNLDEARVKEWAARELRGKHITNANTRFDIHMSRVWGIDLEEQGNTVSDVMHYAALIDDHRKRFAVDVLAKDYLGGAEVARQDERNMENYTAGEVTARAEYQVAVVAQLREKMWPLLDAQELQEVRQLEDDVIFPVCEMERNGALLDLPLLAQYSTECLAAHGRLMMELAQEAGFGFEHTTAGWQRLFEHCGLTPSDSYAEDVVGIIDHPLIQKAHRAGQYSSLNSKTFAAYLKNVDSAGVLRYDINQLRGDDGGTVSGRFSIGYVQQVPNEDNHTSVFGSALNPRRLYISARGQYLEADAAQIEYRIFAHFANNPKVLAAYAEDPRMSFHKFVWGMTKVYKPDMKYTWQKSMNFMKMYGGGLAKLALMMGFITKQQYAEIQSDPDNARKWNDPLLAPAVEIQKIYEQVMPEVAPLQARASHLAKSKCDNDCEKRGKHADFIKSLHSAYPHRGYVKTLLGRRSRFPNNYKTYRGLNRVISGTAADVNKQKLVELHRERKSTGFLMRMTVHDAVGGDAQEPETLARVSEILNRQSFPQIKVPILWECKVGPNWADAKVQE